MSEEVGIILREAVPGDAKDILLMMGQVNKETEFLVLDEAELLLPPETLEEELDYIYESNNNLLLLAIYEGTMIGTASVKAEIPPTLQIPTIASVAETRINRII